MKAHASEAEIQDVIKMVEALDYRAHVIRGVERSAVACVGEERGESHSLQHLESVAGVDRVMPVLLPFKLASREVRPEGSVINVGDVSIGGKRLAECLMGAEYILSEGNPNVVLCERGIRTFETATRNTLDLNAVPLLKEWTHLPVIVDPSHGTGIWSLVTPMALASIAAGADGLLVEVHPDPRTALSDGPQQLKPERFAQLMAALAPVANAVGRSM